ncbi:dihydroorotate dehydrogenase [Pontibacillus halophilus JSM 076056 = DSM 19796]|uniref:Dihydroorotate dehydrogenase n=1 Tax=Pontibacillus halophilus JSM 076056 = DSM 19796 TaxID=1385510 RepID=A0A0A5GEE3_9BACI|nr:ZIP family metal transporter [Pontibacillus halophilus]KGX91581.1 dihydroorotate dehydrogenase [Pontibacillus halophilus JSM 076056 = DSM 19796]
MHDMLLGSLLSAGATGLGALPVLFLKQISHTFRDILLALAAGIMTAAVTFSLIPESLTLGSFSQLGIGMLIGVMLLTLLEQRIPHLHVEQGSPKQLVIDHKALLIIMAITFHNIPEGLSVGVSYAADDGALGELVAMSIAIQNAPEGFIVALFLLQQQTPRGYALLLATLTGAIEIIASIGGFLLTSVMEGLIPYGLAFAAGSMLFIIYKELIPESHGDGHELQATYAFLIGLLVMLFLTNVYGVHI